MHIKADYPTSLSLPFLAVVHAKVMYTYAAQNPDEINIEAGQVRIPHEPLLPGLHRLLLMIISSTPLYCSRVLLLISAYLLSVGTGS